jgi:uncharacterized protein YbcI
MTANAPQHTQSDPRSAPQGPLGLAISNQIVQVLRRHTGRGPTKARTTLATDVVIVMLHDALTRSEHTLVAAGQLDTVREMRRTLHDLMRDELSLAVESVMGRRVTAFLADVDPEAHVAALIFTLATHPRRHGTQHTANPTGEVAPD